MSDGDERITELLHCSFCGRSQAEVQRLIAGPDVYICDVCVRTSDQAIQEAEREARHDDAGMTPERMKAFLDEYVIGQDHAKKVLSVAVFNHYMRIDAPRTTTSRSKRVMC